MLVHSSQNEVVRDQERGIVMTKLEVLCPACDVGKLIPFRGRETYSYKGKQFSIENFEFSRCDACGTELVMPDQSRRNEVHVREEYRKIDGLLTASEIKRIREQFCLTQADAAEIFGGGVNAFSKYERAVVIQSVAMDRLLRLVDEAPSNLYRLIRIAGVEVTGARVSHVICDYESPCSFDSSLLDTVLSSVIVEKRGGPLSKIKLDSWMPATDANTH